MFNLGGKLALVTGASRGLGWAMAQSLAKAGAHVMINARDSKAVEERVTQLRAQGLERRGSRLRRHGPSRRRRVHSGRGERHGRFDILVANAGIQHRKPITEFECRGFRARDATPISPRCGPWRRKRRRS